MNSIRYLFIIYYSIFIQNQIESTGSQLVKAQNTIKNKQLKIESIDQQIYFKSEPNNYYIIDTFRRSNASSSSLVTIVLLDCSVTSLNGDKTTVKWIKDDIDFKIDNVIQNPDQEFKRELFSNGTLKLTFNQLLNDNEWSMKNRDGFLNQQRVTETNVDIIRLASTYRCIASDSFGKVISRPSRVYRLNLIDNGHYNYVVDGNEIGSFIKRPENTTLSTGKRLLLRCRPNLTSYITNLNEKNSNLVQFEWFKDGRLINIGSKINLYKDGSLEVLSVNEQDSGVYRCTAKYRSVLFNSTQAFVKVIQKQQNTTKVSTTATQFIKYIPKFLLWPEDRSMQEDEEVIFDCLAMNDASLFSDYVRNVSESNSAQYYKYKWFKDGVELDLKPSFLKNKNKRMQLVQGFNLRIEKVQESDAGTYTCRICNIDSSDLNGLPKKPLKNNNIESSDLLPKSYYDFNKNSDSYDSNKSDKDDCDERSGVLKVLLPPRFVKRPSNLNVTLKSDAELECSAYGIPAPTIQWYKNGEPIYPSEYFQFNSNQGNLKILGIIAQDEGYYQCLASNELNTIQSVAQLIVQADDYSIENDAEYDSIEPASVSTTTKSFKSKKANLAFSTTTPKNSKSFKKTTQIISSQLTPVVHLSAPINLTVLKVKSRSIHLNWTKPSLIWNTAVNSSKTSTDDLNSNTLFYAVSWKAINTDRQRELNTTDTYFLIDELTPDTVYLIQVCVIMANSKGPAATIESKTATEAKVPGQPLDFQAEFVDMSSQSSGTFTPTLKFKWRKPKINPEGIVKYRLYYQHLRYGPIQRTNKNIGESKPISEEELIEEESLTDELKDQPDSLEDEQISNGEEEKFIDIDIPETSQANNSESFYEFLLEDLLKYSTYKFRLIALDRRLASLKLKTKSFKSKKLEDENVDYEEDNSDIDSAGDDDLDDETDDLYSPQNSAEILIETPSDVPDGPPENLQCETLNTTAILVTWSMPSIEKRNGLIVGYKMAVKENEKQVWTSNLESEPRLKVLPGLLPGRKYSIRVTAKTTNGSGPASDWVTAETFSYEMDESHVPGKPLALFADPTDKSIVVRWSPPANSNVTLVRKYFIKYGIGYPTDEVMVPGNQNSYIINNLVPSSSYIISLRAVNNAGSGEELLENLVTKRKSAIGENENLFPPLNVQALVISPQSIEIRWTDWHLKPEDTIPDDRHYLIRYNVAETSNTKYKYKNSTDRNVIISDLKPNTLYDFAVKLVIGGRESDWSMTSSQMTMEASPAPRDINIKSDPISPSSVIISWLAPNYTSISAFVIYYIDEKTHESRESTNNHKWQSEHVNLNPHQDGERFEHAIRNLKLQTVYYFKIQVRYDRAYGPSSPTFLFKTPNSKGEGGGKLSTSNNDPLESVVLNLSNVDKPYIYTIIGCASIIVFTIILVPIIIFACRRRINKRRRLKQHLGNDNKSRKGSASIKPSKMDKKRLNCQDFESMKHNRDININDYNDENDGNDDNFHKQQQQLLLCSTGSTNSTSVKTEIKMQSQHITCSSASQASTLLKQQYQQQQQQRTPHHGQALIINNPNHIMMNPLSINSNGNVSNGDMEFYSNMSNPQLFSNNSHANSDHPFNNMNAGDSNFSHFSYNQHQSQQPTYGMRGSSINEDNLSQAADLNNDSAAIAAANAAFNAPFNSHLSPLSSTTNTSGVNEQIFLRHTIRPKPIAIPISSTNSTQNGLDQHNIFNASNATRKSYKNLPMATATLISSNSNQQNSNYNNSNQMSGNFNDMNKPTQKLHYTARPYIIDNQVQSNGEYSPASSSHSGGQPQLYDKIGNIMTNDNANSSVSTKSLQQPLKSFGVAQINSSCNQIINNQNSSMSIPNTPAKYCDNLNGNLANMTRSPAKKQLLVSLASSNQTAVSAISRSNNNKSSDILLMMGKSIENVYDKKLNKNNEELSAEMANLAEIMNDLDTMTAQQFEC